MATVTNPQNQRLKVQMQIQSTNTKSTNIKKHQFKINYS